jgi:exopolysaccharide production protein ExoZ
MVRADKLPRTFFTVQYLRGLGALIVVLYHSASQLQRYQPTLIWPEWGAVAVDMFFVISGFVMWYMTATKPIGFGEYWRKRLARSIPIYWAVTAFVVAVMLIAPELVSTSRFEWTHVVTSFFLIPSLHPVLHGQFAPVVIPGWTFEYEFAFYALLSVCLFVPLRFRAAALIVPIVALAALPAVMTSHSIYFEFYTQPLIVQFASGVFLGWLLGKGVRLSPKLAFAMMVAGAAIVPFLPEPSHVVPQIGAYHYMLARTLWYIVPAFCIVGGAVFFEASIVLRSWKIPALIGSGSYSIYLIHPLVLPVVTKAWHLAGLTAAPAWNIAYLALTMAGSVLAGIACHLWVEMPLVRLANRLSAKRHGAAAPALRPVSV